MRFTSYKLLSALQPNSYKITKLYIQQLKKKSAGKYTRKLEDSEQDWKNTENNQNA